jgi:hypothetical protein
VYSALDIMGKGILISVVVVILVLVIGGIYFYGFDKEPITNGGDEPTTNTESELCAKQGETYVFTDPNTPNQCCEGLVDVNDPDSVSVADECYWDGRESGFPGGVCSNCGNGICEEVEGVCGCPEDCVGNEKSRFNTVQEFCDEGYAIFCDDVPEVLDLEVCKLCP